MVLLQEGTDGKYTLTIPKRIVELKGWQKGDNIEFFLVDHGLPAQIGDIVIRKTR